MPFTVDFSPEHFYFLVIQAVASKKNVNIEDWEFKSASELLNEIKIKNVEISELLENFLEAYKDWVETHEKISTSGTQGNLTPEEQKSLNNAISERDRTRSELISKL